MWNEIMYAVEMNMSSLNVWRSMYSIYIFVYNSIYNSIHFNFLSISFLIKSGLANSAAVLVVPWVIWAKDVAAKAWAENEGDDAVKPSKGSWRFINLSHSVIITSWAPRLNGIFHHHQHGKIDFFIIIFLSKTTKVDLNLIGIGVRVGTTTHLSTHRLLHHTWLLHHHGLLHDWLLHHYRLLHHHWLWLCHHYGLSVHFLIYDSKNILYNFILFFLFI